MSDPPAPPKKAFSFDLGFGSGNAPALAPLPREAKSPFRLLVVAPLAPPPHARTRDVAPRASGAARSTVVDRNTLDEAFAALAPAISLQLPDPVLPGTPPIEIELALGGLRALRPAAIADAVAPVRALLDARAEIEEVRRGRRSRADARAKLAPTFPKPAWADALLGAAVASPAEKQASAIDALLSLVDFADAPAGASTPGAADAPALVDAGAAALAIVRGILRHPELRRLEQAWRAVDLLLRNVDASATSVELVAAERDEVADALVARLAVDPSPDLVAIDQEISPSAADLDRLERWAALGEVALAPVVVGGAAGLLGFEDLGKLAHSSRRFRDPQGPFAIAFAALGSRPALGWAVVAMNRAVGRSLHEARVGGLELREVASDALRVNAWVAIAIAAARAHARCGFAGDLAGAAAGRIDGLPVAPSVWEPGEASVEAFPDHEVVAEAAMAGVALVAGVPNRDALVVLRAPVVGGSPRERGSLADQLFVSRVVRTARESLRGSSGRAADARAAALRSALAAAFGEQSGISSSVALAGPALVVTVEPHGAFGVTLEHLELEWPAEG